MEHKNVSQIYFVDVSSTSPGQKIKIASRQEFKKKIKQVMLFCAFCALAPSVSEKVECGKIERQHLGTRGPCFCGLDSRVFGYSRTIKQGKFTNINEKK